MGVARHKYQRCQNWQAHAFSLQVGLLSLVFLLRAPSALCQIYYSASPSCAGGAQQLEMFQCHPPTQLSGLQGVRFAPLLRQLFRSAGLVFNWQHQLTSSSLVRQGQSWHILGTLRTLLLPGFRRRSLAVVLLQTVGSEVLFGLHCERSPWRQVRPPRRGPTHAFGACSRLPNLPPAAALGVFTHSVAVRYR